MRPHLHRHHQRLSGRLGDLSTDFDSDQGGVDDRTEYFDGTNPENDPSDDIQPDDFDGDGIPDAIENQTGTDWTNPDTDGGGMPDGLSAPTCSGSSTAQERPLTRSTPPTTS